MPPSPDLRSECEVMLRRYGTPAFGVARIVGSEVEPVCCLGERRHGSGIAVNDGDLWHIGSCTKSMTATLLARFVEQGTLEWDAPLAPLFEAYGFELHPGFAQLTLRHLMSHRSGMPQDPSSTAVDSCFAYTAILEQRAAFAGATLLDGPTQRLGEAYCYSNPGYIVAGALIEAMTGMTWETLMQRELFAPLGLTTASFGAPGKSSRGVFARMFGGSTVTQPWGHLAGSSGSRFTELSPDDEQADGPAMSGPAGTVHLSLPDLARYVAFHVSRGANVPGYLTPETIAALHTPAPGEDYALGWFAPPVDATGLGKRAVWHEGTNSAWYAGMLLIPEDERGLAWVSNACPDSILDPTTGAMARMIEEVYPRWTNPRA